MRNISDWVFAGHGEKSTLQKEELLSPENVEYIMKYPREFEDSRVNWEDINEVIGAKIATLLGIRTVEAEIAFRNEKRGCLMLHFLNQYGADQGEPGGPLMAYEFEEEYNTLQSTKLKNMELIETAFQLVERFSHFPIMKTDFIIMNVFDILIGNQDRHPYNWQILYKGNEAFFGPLYDNGASLGWQLPDDELKRMLSDTVKLNRYFTKMKVKAGLIENTQPPIKAKQLLFYFLLHYQEEMQEMKKRLELFDLDMFNQYINTFPLISETRKEFLKRFIAFRREKILSIINREEG